MKNKSQSTNHFSKLGEENVSNHQPIFVVGIPTMGQKLLVPTTMAAQASFPRHSCPAEKHQIFGFLAMSFVQKWRYSARTDRLKLHCENMGPLLVQNVLDLGWTKTPIEVLCIRDFSKGIRYAATSHLRAISPCIPDVHIRRINRRVQSGMFTCSMLGAFSHDMS